jgi:hypothetical protein
VFAADILGERLIKGYEHKYGCVWLLGLPKYLLPEPLSVKHQYHSAIVVANCLNAEAVVPAILQTN